MSTFTEEQIDEMLERILRASGTSLRYYRMPSSKDYMREAMRGVIEDVLSATRTDEVTAHG